MIFKVYVFSALAALLLAACSGGLKLDQPPAVQAAVAPPAKSDNPLAKSPAGTAPAAALGKLSEDERDIVTVRGPTIVLYTTPTGTDGVRMPATAFAVPVRGRKVPNVDRFEVMTVDGRRWVASSDVTIGEVERRR
jgi:hypothetical protein